MKHLVDIDDELLKRAQRQLRTSTIRATVDEALRRATEQRGEELRRAWEEFGKLATEIPLVDRSEAW